MIPLSGDVANSKGIIDEKIESYSIKRGTSTLKRGLAHMLKNGVVMDVTTVEQAQIAEDSGAVSVMVLDKLPSDVEKQEVLQELQALELSKKLWIQSQYLLWQNVELVMYMKQKFCKKQMLT